MKNYICIDIGGTAIKYGVIDDSGNIVDKSDMPTQAHLGGPGISQKVVDITEKMLNKHNDICGVCISTAGMVDIEKGEIFYAAPLIPNYIGTNFKKLIKDKFDMPCEVENDVNCAGLAEAISGAGKGSSSVLCLTIGTGIGGCMVIDGQVYHGSSSSACEVGYMHMMGSDFQTLGASRILSKKVAEKKNGDATEWNGIKVFDSAREGDEICIKAIEEMCDVLGYGIANICYVLNPQTIVLGGGIMVEEEYLRPIMEKALRKYLLPSICDKTRLEFAKHRNNAGMLGAFYHFKNRMAD